MESTLPIANLCDLQKLHKLQKLKIHDFRTDV